MVDSKKIGFVIWGVQNGFDKNILTNKPNEEISAFLNDSMRQICRGAQLFFYSLEKTKNYSLLTIFNPDTKDHVGRRAYIAITLYIKRGNGLNGEVIQTLSNLMHYYVKKQGAATINTFTVEMFEEQMLNIQTVGKEATPSIAKEELGYRKFNSENEIETYFKNPSIEGYKRVFFINDPSFKFENISNYEQVNEFKKYYRIGFENNSNKSYTYELNNKSWPSSNEKVVEMMASSGDTICITEVKSNKKYHEKVKNSNQHYYLSNLFYSEPPPPPKNNEKKIIIIITATVCALLLMGTLALFLYYSQVDGKLDEVEKTVINPPSPSATNGNKNDSIPKNNSELEESKVFSTINLLDAGCVIKEKAFPINPYFKKESAKWFQNHNGGDPWINLANDQLTKVIKHFKDNINKKYYKAIGVEIKESTDSITWTSLDKKEQVSIVEYFEKHVIKKKSANIKESNAVSNDSEKEGINKSTPGAETKAEGESIDKCYDFRKQLKDIMAEKSDDDCDLDCKKGIDVRIGTLKKNNPNCKE